MKIWSHSKEYEVRLENTMDFFADLVRIPNTEYVLDRKVYMLYREQFASIPEERLILIDAEESVKGIGTALEICGKMTEIPAKRNAHLISVGGGIIEGNLRYDLGITERISDGFAPDSVGREMPGANCYTARRGNGTLCALTIADPACEAVTKTYDFRGNCLGVSMTRFENELGGRVVVYGTTVKGNGSQALWNYRRQKLFQSLLVWMGADFPMVRDAPKVWMILNLPLHPDAGFLGMTTLINLSEDSPDGVTLRLPDAWRKVKEILRLDSEGSWKPVPFTKNDDSVAVQGELRFSEPTVLRFG